MTQRGISLDGLPAPDPPTVRAPRQPLKPPLQRPLPPGAAEYLLMAQDLKLTCPEGRALYALSRRINGFRHDTVVTDLLTNAKEETAWRWLRHWNRGGSIKALKYTHSQWLKIQRRKAADDRARARIFHQYK